MAGKYNSALDPQAESKGASATQYGLVFGMFELTVFLVSPVVARLVAKVVELYSFSSISFLLPQIGICKAFTGGLTTTVGGAACAGMILSLQGLMCISFGLLNKISNLTIFISLSFLIRIVEAVGNSAFLSSSFTLVASQFPVSMATMFGVVEMSFGVGKILGPRLGGPLYQLGGFTLPFTVLGGVLVVEAVLSRLTLPAMKEREEEEQDSGEFGLMRALKLPPVMLAVLSVFSGSVAVGALQATLERHLATFSLGQLQRGVILTLYGSSNSLLSPVWGWLSDRLSSTLIIFTGSLLLGLASLLLGLAPHYSLTAGSVTVAGAGLAALLVAAFKEAQTAAIDRGFPNTLRTFATISSIWTSTFALGAFVGPSTAGALYDLVGFRWSTLFLVWWNAVVAGFSLTSLMLQRQRAVLRAQYERIA